VALHTEGAHPVHKATIVPRGAPPAAPGNDRRPARGPANAYFAPPLLSARLSACATDQAQLRRCCMEPGCFTCLCCVTNLCSSVASVE